MKFFRNKKQLSNILNQGIIVSLMLGFAFTSAPVLAQTGGVGDPCAGTTTSAPAESCTVKYGIDYSTQFVIQGTSVSTSAGAGVGDVHSVMCCCKSDPASNQALSEAIAAATDAKTGNIKLNKCPANICSVISLPSQVTRSSLTPEPCGASLSTNPLYSPLKNLSDFISKWYAAFFYLAVVLAIIQIFRGGFEYAIAAGNSSKTEEAKAIIVEAVIGLGVALLAAGVLVFLRGPSVFIFQ